MAARRSVPLALALLATLLLATTATAGASYSTKVIVSLKFPAFHGSLSSHRGSCISNRTVKLFRQKSGPDKLLGTDKSNSKGKWSIPIGKHLTSGSYYAMAVAKGACKSARSKPVPID